MESNTGHGQENPAEQVTSGIIEIGHLLDYLRGVKDGRNVAGSVTDWKSSWRYLSWLSCVERIRCMKSQTGFNYAVNT